MKTNLFSPLLLKNLYIKNRIWMPAMSQYSALSDGEGQGVPTDWHRVHYGSRAQGGVGLIIVEATAVSPEGRISPRDLGLWNEHQMEGFKPITEFLKKQNCVPAIQLAHAGRKASVDIPWHGGKPLPQGKGGWEVLAPSAMAYSDQHNLPKEMDYQDLDLIKKQFVNSAELALKAGFQAIELHMAHGYLMHQFLSPISNQRFDHFGGTLENRIQFPLEVVDAVQTVWPKDLPLMVRISATDWVEGGWDLYQALAFSIELKKRGVDFIDVSSGGLSPLQKLEVFPHYQVPFATQIKEKANIAVGAVGLITEPHLAHEVIAEKKADVVFLGRELLRNPYWAIQASEILKGLGGSSQSWPNQYERAKY